MQQTRNDAREHQVATMYVQPLATDYNPKADLHVRLKAELLQSHITSARNIISIQVRAISCCLALLYCNDCLSMNTSVNGPCVDERFGEACGQTP